MAASDVHMIDSDDDPPIEYDDAQMIESSEDSDDIRPVHDCIGACDLSSVTNTNFIHRIEALQNILDAVPCDIVWHKNARYIVRENVAEIVLYLFIIFYRNQNQIIKSENCMFESIGGRNCDWK